MQKALIFFLLFFPSLLPAQYISKFASETLSQCQVVASGTPEMTEDLGPAGIFVSLRVNAVYWGKVDINRPLNLLYKHVKDKNVLFQDEYMVFLRPMTAANTYQVVKEFSCKGKDAEAKIKALQTLLAIEDLPMEMAQQRHFEYCINQFQSEDLWDRWNALWEWEYAVTTRPQAITPEMLAKIVDIYENIRELRLKNKLRTTIIKVKRHVQLPTPKEQKAPEEEPIEVQIERAFEQYRQAQTPDQKAIALLRISRYPCAVSRQALVEALKDPSANIRALALFYLNSHGTPQEIPVVFHLLKTDPSLRVRKNAIEVLASLGYVDAADEIARYKNLPYTRYAAKQALSQLIAPD